MPSNQYRPLTRPRGAHSSDLVASAGKVLTVFSAIFFGLSFLYSLGPSSGSTYRPRGRSGSCDPWNQPGFVESKSAGLSTWRTYDPSCQAPALLANLRSTLDLSPRDPSPHAPIAADTSATHSEQLDFLANRTVLLIGDLVDHTLVSHFCELVGRKSRAVDANHPWGEALGSVPDAHKPRPASQRHEESDDATLAHYCYLPEYDFMITSVYHYGADTANSWTLQKIYHPPSLFEHRLSDLFVPYTQAYASSASTSPSLPPPRQRAAPDLIFFNSGFWDLARWASEDVRSGASAVTDLGEKRLFWWRARAVDMLASIRAVWKETPIVWRSTHYPADTEAATVDWFMGVKGQPNENHPLFHVNRIFQLNQALTSALAPHGDDIVKGSRNRAARLPSGVRHGSWGDIMLGQDYLQPDPLNPGVNSGGALFADMMLWELRNAVQSRR